MIIVNAVQDATDRRKISVTARGLQNGTTVFLLGDGTQQVVTAVAGIAIVTDHVYAADGTYEITVYNGSDAGHLSLLPVKAGVAWPSSELLVRYDPEQVPFGVELTLTGAKASHASITWGDGTPAQVVPVPIGATLFVDHRYPGPAVYDITVNTYTETDTATDWPIAQAAVVVSIDPDTAVVGGPDVLMTVTGIAFQPGAVIVFNGGDEPDTIYISATQVATWVEPATASGPAIVPVGVRNPGGAALSNTVDFTFTAA